MGEIDLNWQKFLTELPVITTMVPEHQHVIQKYIMPFYASEDMEILDMNNVDDYFRPIFTPAHKNQIREKHGKEYFESLKIAFYGAVVLFMSGKERFKNNYFNSSDQLLAAYPHFRLQNLKENELQFLLKYRNMMVVATELYRTTSQPKQAMIQICAALEGSGRKYITGSRQSDVVERRVQIYFQESGREREKREKRLNAGIPVYKRKFDPNVTAQPIKTGGDIGETSSGDSISSATTDQTSGETASTKKTKHLDTSQSVYLCAETGNPLDILASLAVSIVDLSGPASQSFPSAN